MPTTEHGDDGEATGAPRWFKALAVVGALVIAGLLILVLAVGGHGPGRHTLPRATLSIEAPR